MDLPGGRLVSDDLTVVGRSTESIDYQKQIDSLRARGCRCSLIYREGRAMPLNRTDGQECDAVDHYPDLASANEGP